jgi:membrane protein DedA with SNARE-associated domain
MFSQLVEIFVRVIETTGYPGVAFLMALESMVAPVPSEAVMPFAGFLMFVGKMSFWPIVLWSTLGSIIGSLISYAIGFYLGRPFVIKFGKYFFLNEHHLAWTENFFQKFGNKTIFVSRFIPVVRHLISIPAGTSKMNIWQFSIYTVLGAALWNAFLTYIGFYLGSNWAALSRYTEKFDVIIVILLVVGVIYFFWKNLANKK